LVPFAHGKSAAATANYNFNLVCLAISVIVILSLIISMLDNPVLPAISLIPPNKGS
jgi:hypothetical protein